MGADDNADGRREESGTVLEYEVDHAGWIHDVSQKWERFAVANGARELTRSRTIGRQLWEFFEGEHTRFVHRQVHHHVLRTRTEVAYAYRCDAPAIERHMRMRMIPLPGHRVLYRSVLERSVPRDPSMERRLRHAAGIASLRHCSQCDRYEVGALWMEIGEAIAAVDPTERSVELRHTLCPGCHDRILSLCDPPPGSD